MRIWIDGQSNIIKIDPPSDLFDLVSDIVSKPDYDKNPFFIVDFDDLYFKYTHWMKSIPRVTPYYAMKCNDDINMLKVLAHLGTGFDCASLEEIQMILDIGVSPDRIVYANPCKQDTHLKYSYDHQVNSMTFDTVEELYKIKKYNKNARIILRIVTDDSNAIYKLSNKYGADMESSFKLIDTAVKLNMEIIGISFHVGCSQMSPFAFNEPIKNARTLFDYAKTTHGIQFTLLDIGGGFPGLADALFDSIATEINKSLDTYFHNYENEGIKIISEPGTYFAHSAFTLCATIIGKRVVKRNNEKMFMYYLNDGIYSSFNGLRYNKDLKFPFSRLINKGKENDDKLISSSLWGPTCDAGDMIAEICELPEMNVDETLIFENMGAYTTTIACSFNRMLCNKFYYIALSHWDSVKGAFGI